jgi:DNA helicase-2/ATP-dependent DNA helicase PcrA
MILTRSSFAVRAIESALLTKDIPYKFVRGSKLLESAHVRDVVSALRITANHLDDIAWMRYLTLWPGVGEKTASDIMAAFNEEADLKGCVELLRKMAVLPNDAVATLTRLSSVNGNVSKAVRDAADGMESCLKTKYAKQDWERRKPDFQLVEKIAEKHTSIIAFLADYALDPINETQLREKSTDDAVTVITIHSAKGVESKVCYVLDVSPGSFPSRRAVETQNALEEERRVLYVALTRAQDELIVTRRFRSTGVFDGRCHADGEGYFLHGLPSDLTELHDHRQACALELDALGDDGENEPCLSIDYS